MAYFHITPVDTMSASRNWFVDDVGFEFVKDHYQNYKKTEIPIDRWSDFRYEETKIIPIDFGGMCSANEPKIKIPDDDSVYTMMASHLPYLIEAIQEQSDDTKSKGLCYIGMRWWALVISLERANNLLPRLMQQEDNCAEMIEGIERDFQNKLKVINSNGPKVLSLRRKKTT